VYLSGPWIYFNIRTSLKISFTLNWKLYSLTWPYLNKRSPSSLTLRGPPFPTLFQIFYYISTSNPRWHTQKVIKICQNWFYSTILMINFVKVPIFKCLIWYNFQGEIVESLHFIFGLGSEKLFQEILLENFPRVNLAGLCKAICFLSEDCLYSNPDKESCLTVLSFI
jgi:hypothetical protein